MLEVGRGVGGGGGGTETNDMQTADPPATSQSKHRTESSDRGGNNLSQRGFALASTVTSTVTSTLGHAKSLISRPLSLIAAASEQRSPANGETIWPFKPGTFVKIAQKISEERKKARESRRVPSSSRIHAVQINMDPWVIVVGSHQIQAQKVASRLMLQGVEKIAVIRGNGL
mmetsp:Transcript_43062/g.69985  ORF Transcript_43062/g.69985 Transcript_43062/m.69985 type:complete len:172 (-) Transcript_43062:118-633(-)